MDGLMVDYTLCVTRIIVMKFISQVPQSLRDLADRLVRSDAVRVIVITETENGEVAIIVQGLKASLPHNVGMLTDAKSWLLGCKTTTHSEEPLYEGFIPQLPQSLRALAKQLDGSDIARATVVIQERDGNVWITCHGVHATLHHSIGILDLAQSALHRTLTGT